jgi:hypothetical protein
VRWGGSDATKVNGLEAKSIGCSKDASNVVKTSYVVQNNNNGSFIGIFKLSY